MVAGLLRGAALESLFQVRDQAPRDLIGMRHQHVVLGCLHEARAQLEAPTRTALEKAGRQWLDFELKNGPSDWSHLGSQRMFPERLLLEVLSQAEGAEKYKAMATLGTRPALSADAVQALIAALEGENKHVRSAAVSASGHHMAQLFIWLARLEPNQVKALYIQVLFPHSCEQIAPLYLRDHQLHFYTATGPGQPIPLRAAQRQRIGGGFSTVQAKAGIVSWLEEAPAESEA
jgi:hypothetical protein